MEDIEEEPSIKFPGIREASLHIHEDKENKLKSIGSVSIAELSITNPPYALV